MRKPATVLFGTGMVLFTVTAFGGAELTPKVVLHVSATTTTNTICSTWNPNAKGIPCSDYVTEGPLGQNLLVYMVVAQVDTPVVTSTGGISGISMGIEYNGNEGQGVDVFQWFMCADGIEYAGVGPRGPWPASGSGNVVIWLTCQNQHIGDDGIHAVVGAFSVYAYSADQITVTPNRSINPPIFALANCDGAEFRPDSVTALGRAGFGVPGRNTCASCATRIAVVDVDPNTLNLVSQARYVTAHVELPSDLDPTQIDLGSVRLNETAPALLDVFELGDWNQNGIPDVLVKFERDAVDQTLQEGAAVPVTVAGIIDGCQFTGTDHVRVIRPRLSHPNEGESYLVGMHALIEWENPNGWNPSHAQIHYSADDGETWASIADHVVGQSYVWAVPSEPTQHGRVRVVLVDENGVMGYDTSDGTFAIHASTTGIGRGIPTAHRLYPNTPNPFAGSTRIAFDMPEAGRVTIKIVDLNGRVVRTLIDDSYPAGNHEVSWDARDASGNEAAGGIYFLNMKAQTFTDTKRIYLRK